MDSAFRWQAAVLASLVSTLAVAQPDTLKGPAAFGDWRTDKPGVRRLISAQDLPSPSEAGSASNFATVVAMPAGAKPQVPAGFTVDMLASGLKAPRVVRVAPNGDVFLADSRANSIIVLRDKNKDGVAEERFVFSDKLSQPFGMAFHKDWFYVANTDSIVRLPSRWWKPCAISSTGIAC